MTMIFTHDTRGSGFGELAASGISPARLEQYRLDRLRELRAVIQTLRAEDARESSVPGRFEQTLACAPR
jgi:hypothetical protein